MRSAENDQRAALITNKKATQTTDFFMAQ
jgi:hypothetical protein